MDRRKDFFYKILYERPFYGTNPVALYNSAKNSKYLLQRFRCLHSLNAHNGCVNTISWNSNGRFILSGSDDLHLSITNAFTGEIKTKIRTGHMTNIFSAKYLPGTDDMKIVSCSGDGVIIYTDLNRPETTYQNIFDCQDESVYDIVTVPNDPHTFLTCSHDNTVRWYDLRVKQSCQKHRIGHRQKCRDDVLVNCDYPVTAIAINHLLPWQLAVGCSDSIIRIYDRRMLTTKSLRGTCPSTAEQNASIVAKFTYDGLTDFNRITSLAYSRNCQQLLASYSNDNLYLFNLYEVRDTINIGNESDMINDRPRRLQPPYKRFRLRGDWSDTGPSALTTEELRNNDSPQQQSSDTTVTAATQQQSQNQTSSRSTTNSSIHGDGSGQSSSSTATTTTTTPPPPPPPNRSNDRLRQLNTILSILFRNSLRNDILNENVEETSSSSSTTMTTATTTTTTTTTTVNNMSTQATNNSSPSSSLSSNDSHQNTPNTTVREQRTNHNQNNNQNDNQDNNSESSSDNSLNYFIQIFDDDIDYPYYSNREQNNNVDNDDDPMNNDGNDNSTTMIDGDGDGGVHDHDHNHNEDDDDFDSDTTSDSVFFHDISSIGSNSTTTTARQRSRSSSSNDSRQSSRRKIRNNTINGNNRPKMNNNMIGDQNNRITGLTSFDNKRTRTYKIKNFKKFTGHRNSRTIKKATFWGDNYIISGSDCGHIFFWSIETGEVVMVLEGDQHVVNCLQPHPNDPILASSGIDYDIKIWGADSDDNLFDLEKTKKLINRNKYLLQESRDTVTVPARFVLSLFSSMQQRQQRFRDRQQQQQQQNSNNSNNNRNQSSSSSTDRLDSGWISDGGGGNSRLNNNRNNDIDMDDSC
ncbi:DDB1- and CUL4-associated factor 6-like isoform X2 [Dermatophagoides farinae]|uniref:DDB1- and CUL4-associated factor 6-like isoform X2 n=1 Tax=Dermatophagoides farinae TaxID=6954 RepID=UPI003F5F7DE8